MSDDQPSEDNVMEDLLEGADVDKEVAVTQQEEATAPDKQVEELAKQSVQLSVHAKSFCRWISYLSCHGKSIKDGKVQDNVDTIKLYVSEKKLYCQCIADGKNIVIPVAEYTDVADFKASNPEGTVTEAELPFSISDTQQAFELGGVTSFDGRVTLSYDQNVYTVKGENVDIDYPGPANIQNDYSAIWEEKRASENIEDEQYVRYDKKLKQWVNFNSMFTSNAYFEFDSAAVRRVITASSKITGKNFTIQVDPEQATLKMIVNAISGKWKVKTNIVHRKFLVDTSDAFEKVYSKGLANAFGGIYGFVAVSFDSLCTNPNFNYMVVDTQPHSKELNFRVVYVLAHTQQEE
jgi:hypothetical protein